MLKNKILLLAVLVCLTANSCWAPSRNAVAPEVGQQTPEEAEIEQRARLFLTTRVDTETSSIEGPGETVEQVRSAFDNLSHEKDGDKVQSKILQIAVDLAPILKEQIALASQARADKKTMDTPNFLVALEEVVIEKRARLFLADRMRSQAQESGQETVEDVQKKFNTLDYKVQKQVLELAADPNKKIGYQSGGGIVEKTIDNLNVLVGLLEPKDAKRYLDQDGKVKEIVINGSRKDISDLKEAIFTRFATLYANDFLAERIYSQEQESGQESVEMVRQRINKLDYKVRQKVFEFAADPKKTIRYQSEGGIVEKTIDSPNILVGLLTLPDAKQYIDELTGRVKESRIGGSRMFLMGKKEAIRNKLRAMAQAQKGILFRSEVTRYGKPFTLPPQVGLPTKQVGLPIPMGTPQQLLNNNNVRGNQSSGWSVEKPLPPVPPAAVVVPVRAASRARNSLPPAAQLPEVPVAQNFATIFQNIPGAGDSRVSVGSSERPRSPRPSAPTSTTPSRPGSAAGSLGSPRSPGTAGVTISTVRISPDGTARTFNDGGFHRRGSV